MSHDNLNSTDEEDELGQKNISTQRKQNNLVDKDNLSESNTNRRSVLKGMAVGMATSIGVAGPASAGSRTAKKASDCTSMPPKAQGGVDIGPINLTEVQDSVGLIEPLKGMMVHGIAAGDATGNGHLDLFVGTFTDRNTSYYEQRGAEGKSPDKLLLGGPDGFTESQTFPEMYGRTTGAAFVDLNNNGHLDLVISRNHNRTEEFRDGTDKFNAYDNSTIVMKNDGDGNFSRVTQLDEGHLINTARAVVPLDFDGDGLLDLFIVDDHYYQYDERLDMEKAHSRLFKNQGDFEFTDVTEESGLPWGVTGLGAAAADLTGNSLPDLVVGGEVGRDEQAPGADDPALAQFGRVFVNKGGSFQEIEGSEFQVQTGRWDDEAGGVAIADLNRNGRMDLVIGSHYHSPYMIEEEGYPPVRIYLNRGTDDDGLPVFEDVTEAAGIPTIYGTRVPDVGIVDLDNSGWPDIQTGTSAGDHTNPAIFRHTGLDGDIPQFATPDGLDNDRQPAGSHWEDVDLHRYWSAGTRADFNRDGQMDIFLGAWDPGLASLMQYNETDAGNWLTIDLVPQPKALGATVEIFCPGQLGNPDALVGARSVVANGGYASGVPSETHFGLGQAKTVDVQITLPHNQGAISHRGVRTNQRIEIDIDKSSRGPPSDDRGRGPQNQQ